MGGLGSLKNYLGKNGSSIDFLDDLFGTSAYMTYVNEKVQEMLADTPVTDEEIQKYYEDNYVCAKHILIDKGEDAEASKKLAEEILERAKNGEDFDKMAQDYSTDPGLESNPQGYVFTDGEMVKPFEDWLFDAARTVGETGIVETEYGYHVMYFVGNSGMTYRDFMIESTLRNEDLTAWETGLIEGAELVVSNTKYIKTDLTLSSGN